MMILDRILGLWASNHVKSQLIPNWFHKRDWNSIEFW